LKKASEEDKIIRLIKITNEIIRIASDYLVEAVGIEGSAIKRRGKHISPPESLVVLLKQCCMID